MENESILSEGFSEETSEEPSEETSEEPSEVTSETSSQVYTETYTDYTPYFDQVIHNQQIFIGLFVALVSLIGVSIVLKYFFGLMK